MKIKTFIKKFDDNVFKDPLGILLLSHSQGWGCGYVGVPKGHPWWGIADTWDVPTRDFDEEITWSDSRLPHLKEPDEDDYWWVGFDTAHGHNGPHHDQEWVLAKTLELRDDAENATKNR